MRIDAENNCCTIIVTVEGAPDAVAFASRHAAEGLAQFAAFDGFIAGATHLSEDGRRVVQYLQWRTEASHRACLDDPKWDEHPSSRRFMTMVEKGELLLNVGVYRVMKTI